MRSIRKKRKRRDYKGAGRLTLAGFKKKKCTFSHRNAVKSLHVEGNCKQFKPCFLFTVRFAVFTLDSVMNNYIKHPLKGTKKRNKRKKKHLLCTYWSPSVTQSSSCSYTTTMRIGKTIKHATPLDIMFKLFLICFKLLTTTYTIDWKMHYTSIRMCNAGTRCPSVFIWSDPAVVPLVGTSEQTHNSLHAGLHMAYMWQ